MTTHRAILLVEDNEDDVFLMKRALKAARVMNPLYVVEDGQEAVDYLGGAGKFANRESYPLPAVVFLDLKLPLISGHDVLAWIRRQYALESVVVIVLTSSNEASDLSRSYALGANSYLVKPPTPEQLEELAKAFKWYWLEYNQFAND
ncbi:MAG TPA: response regulator [Candidatus Limnocylindria bacterium]|nr:response regulator [Candidatus Limnocylindria bacterium]